MDSSRDWPVLRQMDAEGGYPEAVWLLADAMTSGADVPAGKPGATVAEVYRSALGCDDG